MGSFIIQVGDLFVLGKSDFGTKFFWTSKLSKAMRFQSWYEARMAIEEQHPQEPSAFTIREEELFHVEPLRNDESQELLTEKDASKLELAYMKTVQEKWEQQRINTNLSRNLELASGEVAFFTNESQVMTERCIALIEEKEKMRIFSYEQSRLLTQSQEALKNSEKKLAECITALRTIALMDRAVVQTDDGSFNERARQRAVAVLRLVDV